MKTSSALLNLDKTGFTAALLCAIHCAGMPYLVSLAPLAGLRFLTHPLIEYTLILLSLVIASLALHHGYYRHHRNVFPALCMLTGFLLVGWGQFARTDVPEVISTIAGATLVAAAHLLNWRMVKRWNAEYPGCLTKYKD